MFVDNYFSVNVQIFNYSRMFSLYYYFEIQPVVIKYIKVHTYYTEVTIVLKTACADVLGCARVVII